MEESRPSRSSARIALLLLLLFPPRTFEAVYNRQRRHSAIDMQSPVDYEERYWDRRAAA
jgi:transposase InsO family protein